MFCARGGMGVPMTDSPRQDGNLPTPHLSRELSKNQLAREKEFFQGERKSESDGQSLKLLQIATSPYEIHISNTN